MAPAGSARSSFDRSEFDRRDVLGALIAAALVNLIGALGVPFTRPEGAWFRALETPWFYPPEWAFGIVWPILYALMGIAAYLVWRQRRRRGRAREAVRSALVLFVVQLAVNVSWTPVFFVLEDPFAALVVIVVLLLLVAATVFAFDRVDRLAALLLVPYVVWVGFATVLTYSIWTMNV